MCTNKLKTWFVNVDNFVKVTGKWELPATSPFGPNIVVAYHFLILEIIFYCYRTNFVVTRRPMGGWTGYTGQRKRRFICDW